MSYKVTKNLRLLIGLVNNMMPGRERLSGNNGADHQHLNNRRVLCLYRATEYIHVYCNLHNI